MIAGALILLTLIQTSELPDPSVEAASNSIPNSSVEIGGSFVSWIQINLNRLIASMVGPIVIVFAFSALSAAIFKNTQVGRRLMVGGFAYVFVELVILAY